VRQLGPLSRMRFCLRWCPVPAPETNMLTSEQALEQAKEFARAERDKDDNEIRPRSNVLRSRESRAQVAGDRQRRRKPRRKNIKLASTWRSSAAVTRAEPSSGSREAAPTSSNAGLMASRSQFVFASPGHLKPAGPGSAPPARLAGC
jgi:hypothetical protein